MVLCISIRVQAPHNRDRIWLAAYPKGEYGKSWDRMVQCQDGRAPAQSGRLSAVQHLEAGGVETPGLNICPSYAEWLMMWPLGWAELKPLEMDKFRELQQQHSLCGASHHDHHLQRTHHAGRPHSVGRLSAGNHHRLAMA